MEKAQVIKTVKVGINHTGSRAVVVHTVDGTITVQPGQELEDQEILPISEDKADYYKSLGVKFTGLSKADKAEAPDTVALEQDVADAQTAYNNAKASSEKPEATDAERDALKDALDKLTAAQEALAKARKPVKKPAK